MKNARHPALAAYLMQHAIRTGDFTLASGKKATFYCDGKLVTFAGEGIAHVVGAILEELEDVTFDAVGGMDMGATPMVSAVVMELYRNGRVVPGFVVRKDVKAHGTKKAIEGPLPESKCRVVILEDVVTTGGSLMKAIDEIEARGHEIVLAISILDREAGGATAFEARGVRYQPLVTLSELPIARPAPE